MKKRKSISALSNEVAALLQKLVRIKAADSNGNCVCVSCGRINHWTEMDGGHFISRRHMSTRLMEENIHPQCKMCNGYLKGNLTSYTLYMIDRYGRKFIDELELLKQSTKKYTRTELEDLKQEFRQRITETLNERSL